MQGFCQLVVRCSSEPRKISAVLGKWAVHGVSICSHAHNAKLHSNFSTWCLASDHSAELNLWSKVVWFCSMLHNRCASCNLHHPLIRLWHVVDNQETKYQAESVSWACVLFKACMRAAGPRYCRQEPEGCTPWLAVPTYGYFFHGFQLHQWKKTNNMPFSTISNTWRMCTCRNGQLLMPCCRQIFFNSVGQTFRCCEATWTGSPKCAATTSILVSCFWITCKHSSVLSMFTCRMNVWCNACAKPHAPSKQQRKANATPKIVRKAGLSSLWGSQSSTSLTLWFAPLQ